MSPIPLAAHEIEPMRTFLVSYDLSKPSLNQPYLADAIMSLGAAWARPLDNVWYLRAEENPDEIEVRLTRLLDENDGLLIQETRGEAAMVNTELRWFRQRRKTAEPIENSDNVVVFPSMPHATSPRATPENASIAYKAAG